MRAQNDHLTLLPEAERQAIYDRPEFDDFQRAEYFAFTPAELSLAQQRAGLPEQILCLLQIGYFKAKRAFFTLTELPDDDSAFLRERYFPEQSLQPRPIRSAEYYVQRRQILQLFDYRSWSQQDTAQLARKAAFLARRDVTPAFILTEVG